MVAHEFDPGAVEEPFASLVRDYPGEDVYPADDFRTEWGPIFHRGRLDGSARALVLGQDPAASETIARRILVGEAGRRVQGLLRKLGFDRSYVMVNTFLYSVVDQERGERHRDDEEIVEYRHRWLEALLAPGRIDVVILFGGLARDAWDKWRADRADSPRFKHLTHPTQPEAVGRTRPQDVPRETRELLENWNAGVQELRQHVEDPDLPGPFEPYGETWTDADRPPIPERDLPAGLPAWMRTADRWARRPDRATIAVTVPDA